MAKEYKDLKEWAYRELYGFTPEIEEQMRQEYKASFRGGKVPPVQVPRVSCGLIIHGRWLRTDAYPHRIYCSVCFATFIRNDEFPHLEDIPHNYCPNCGARMDGGENGSCD